MPSQNGIRAHFSELTARAPISNFLMRIYSETVAAGAKEVVLVDTIGVCTPEAAEFLVRWTREHIGSDISRFTGTVTTTLALRTAIAIAAVRGGATWVQGTINGMGERAGNAISPRLHWHCSAFMTCRWS